MCCETLLGPEKRFPQADKSRSLEKRSLITNLRSELDNLRKRVLEDLDKRNQEARQASPQTIRESSKRDFEAIEDTGSKSDATYRDVGETGSQKNQRGFDIIEEKLRHAQAARDAENLAQQVRNAKNARGFDIIEEKLRNAKGLRDFDIIEERMEGEDNLKRSDEAKKGIIKASKMSDCFSKKKTCRLPTILPSGDPLHAVFKYLSPIESKCHLIVKYIVDSANKCQCM